MARISVGVLRGGTSSEYDLSLKTGAAMLSVLPDDRYDTRDILIDKHGTWHARGIPVDPIRALSQVDVALVGLHGGIGEDGTVQRILERVGVPYVGSRPLPVAQSLNKVSAREVWRRAGIPMPRAISFAAANALDTGEMARLVFSQFGPPYLVKPGTEGASNGVRYVATIMALPDAIADTLDDFSTAVIEEFIRGDEATVGLIEGFRGEELYALPPARVAYPEDLPHIAFVHHTDGLLRHICPSDFSHEEKQKLMDIARRAHRALGLSHLSRADLILSSRGPILLEIDALPHLFEGSGMHSMLESVGSSLRELLEHAIALSRR